MWTAARIDLQNAIGCSARGVQQTTGRRLAACRTANATAILCPLESLSGHRGQRIERLFERQDHPPLDQMLTKALWTRSPPCVPSYGPTQPRARAIACRAVRYLDGAVCRLKRHGKRPLLQPVSSCKTATAHGCAETRLTGCPISPG